MAIKNRYFYGFTLIGGIIGIIAAFLQTTEKLQLLKVSDQPLVCDLNSVFSCSSVLRAWQSSVFGFPNSLICMIVFTIFATVGFVGLSGGELAKKARLGVQGLALFFLGFALWFLQQSTFVIGSLCLLCLFCFAGLLLVNGSLLRLNAEDLPISKPAKDRLQIWIASGADIFGWVLIALFVAFVMILRFA